MNTNINTTASFGNSFGEDSDCPLIDVQQVQKMVERRDREIKDNFLQALSFEIIAAVASGRNYVYVNFSRESDRVEIGGGVYCVEYQRTGKSLNEFVAEIRDEISSSGYSAGYTVPKFRVSW